MPDGTCTGVEEHLAFVQCSSWTGLAKHSSAVTRELASLCCHYTYGCPRLMCIARKHGQAVQSAARHFRGLPGGVVQGVFSFIRGWLAPCEAGTDTPQTK